MHVAPFSLQQEWSSSSEHVSPDLTFSHLEALQRQGSGWLMLVCPLENAERDM